MFPERDMHWFVDTQQVIVEGRKEGSKVGRGTEEKEEKKERGKKGRRPR